MSPSDISDFFEDTPAFYCGHKASDVGTCSYKIHDDSIRLRHFLGADDADGIEAILSEHDGHSLHEYIDGMRHFVLS